MFIVNEDPLESASSNSIVPYEPQQPDVPNRLPQVLPGGPPRRLRFTVNDGSFAFEVEAHHSIVVGRNSSIGAVDVDLSPYNADELGISRRHVQFDLVGDRLMVKDLHSVNGSCLNGKPLTPNHYYPVAHGDELKIGRLKMRIYLIYD